MIASLPLKKGREKQNKIASMSANKSIGNSETIESQSHSLVAVSWENTLQSDEPEKKRNRDA
jgi:hypothetical protein